MLPLLSGYSQGSTARRGRIAPERRHLRAPHAPRRSAGSCLVVPGAAHLCGQAGAELDLRAPPLERCALPRSPARGARARPQRAPRPNGSRYLVQARDRARSLRCRVPTSAGGARGHHPPPLFADPRHAPCPLSPACGPGRAHEQPLPAEQGCRHHPPNGSPPLIRHCNLGFRLLHPIRSRHSWSGLGPRPHTRRNAS